MSYERKLYSSYRTSKLFRGRHRPWLKKYNYRCALTGLPVGKTWYRKGKKIFYFGYNFHHAYYKKGYMGKEELGADIFPLNPVAHRLIIHRLLGGGLKAGSQPLGKFPNFGQRIMNVWLRVKYKAPIVYTTGLVLWVLMLRS